jgi:hypothetical protein
MYTCIWMNEWMNEKLNYIKINLNYKQSHFIITFYLHLGHSLNVKKIIAIAKYTDNNLPIQIICQEILYERSYQSNCQLVVYYTLLLSI